MGGNEMSAEEMATPRMDALSDPTFHKEYLEAKALLVEIYHLLLTGDVKFVGNLQGGAWTFPDRARAAIYAIHKDEKP